MSHGLTAALGMLAATKEERMRNYKETIYAGVTGFFYLCFSIGGEYDEQMKGAFAAIMLFLPGFTFPIATTYDPVITGKKDSRVLLHLMLSVLIYHANVWAFSLETRFKFKEIVLLTGFTGSVLYLLMTKWVFNLSMSIQHILVIGLLSSIAFIGVVWPGRSLVHLGIAVFLWTVANGYYLNKIRLRRAAANTAFY